MKQVLELNFSRTKNLSITNNRFAFTVTSWLFSRYFTVKLKINSHNQLNHNSATKRFIYRIKTILHANTCSETSGCSLTKQICKTYKTLLPQIRQGTQVDLSYTRPQSSCSEALLFMGVWSPYTTRSQVQNFKRAQRRPFQTPMHILRNLSCKQPSFKPSNLPGQWKIKSLMIIIYRNSNYPIYKWAEFSCYT